MITIYKNAVKLFQASRINFKEGSNITLNISKNIQTEIAEIEIVSTGGSGVSDGDKGDITVSSGGTVWTVDNLAITNAKINDVDATKVTEDTTHRFATDAEKSTWNAKQTALISGTNIKTVNSTSLLGSGNLAVQDVLVSATNIKTINGSSILGSGDLTVSGSGLAQYQVRQLIRR